MSRQRLIPCLVVAGAHALYAVFLMVALPQDASLQPVLAFAWFGSTAMIAIFAMLVLSGRCPTRHAWWLLLLLLPDLAGLYFLASNP